MKTLGFVLAAALAAASLSFAQEAGPVVVTIGDRDFTAAELEHLRRNLPDMFRRNTEHMDAKTFVDTLGFLLTVSGLAEEEKLAETEPFKTQLWFNQINFLAQAYLSQINSKLTFEDSDSLDYYERNRAQFEQKRVSAIYFDYSPIPELAEKEGKPVVTERDAWEKAEKLLVELRNGADFAQIAREHSNDPASAAQGGDLGMFDPDDETLSPEVRKAIFELAEGQISPPIREGGRYYLFKVTEVQAKPFEQVQGEVLQKVQTEKLQRRLEEIRNSVKIDYKDPNLFGAPAAGN
jgi:peptidyl-prolyl cis-trans isomerase C